MIFSSLKVNLWKLNCIFHRHGNYRAIFFEVLDLFINSIQSRFDQPGFKVFLNLEYHLIHALTPTGNIDVPTPASLHEMYGDEIDTDALEVEANKFRTIMSNCWVGCFKDVYNKTKTCPESEKELIPNIMHIIKLLLINPATSSSPERRFSTSRRLKFWLRSTMTSQRFNGLVLLNMNKKCTDQLDLIKFGNEFVNPNEQRRKHFGKYTENEF